MARLKLRTGESYSSVGTALLEMAEAVRRDTPEQRFSPDGGMELSERFKSLFDERFVDGPPTLRATGDEGPVEDGVRLVLHFDRTVSEGGKTMRIVNVAVPDLTGKGRIDRDTGLSGIAEEAIGFITICGCAG